MLCMFLDSYCIAASMNYVVLKASSYVTLSVIFPTRRSIVCINSVTCNKIYISLALMI